MIPATATSSAQIVLTWNASPGATTYNVYRATTSGGEGNTPFATGTTSTTYTDSGLADGTTYYYEVTAVNAYGESPKSNEASATTLPAIPAVPTSLVATPSNGQVALTWSASSGATSYNVYRSTTKGGEGTTAYQTGITSASYTDTGVTNGTTYYYTVAAVNSGGTSAQSSEVNATPNPAPSFSGEKAWDDGTNFFYQVSYSGTYAHFLLFLDTDNSAATGYPTRGIGADYMIQDSRLYKSTANGSWSWSSVGPVTMTFPSAGTVQFEVPLASIGAPKSAKVAFTESTANWAGVNDPTVVTFTSSQILLTPTNVAATPSNAQVALSWTGSAWATSYNVYRSTTKGGEGTTAYQTGITGTSYTDTGVTNGTTYYYTVAAVNSGGASAQSSEVNATPNPPISFSGEKAWDDGTNFFYQATYTGTYSHFQVFLDTDNNVATGFPTRGIGADYLIQDGRLYKSTANGSWSWSSVGLVTVTFPSAGTVQFECPLTSIGSPASAKAAFTVYNANWVGYNDPAVVTYTASQTLVTPTNVKATAGTNQVSLSWTGCAAATSYNVYRSTTKGGEGTTAYQTGITSTSYTDTGLTNGTTYYYTVAAVNSGGASAQSSEVNATPNPPISFSGEKAWDDGTNFFYQATYTGTYSHFQVFLDTDNNVATGFPTRGIGADYLIQDGRVYKSTANGSWAWSAVGLATITFPTAGTVQLECPLTSIGSPASAKAAFTVYNSNWIGYNDPTVVTFIK